MNRAKFDLVNVAFGDVDPMSLATVANYERAMEEATSRRKKVRALISCSPHNPLGRYYIPEVLEAYLRLCSKHGIHMISDEVYAMSISQIKTYRIQYRFALCSRLITGSSLIHRCCMFSMA